MSKTNIRSASQRRFPESSPEFAWLKRLWSWVALGLILMSVVVVRIRLLSIPFERDEGEFAYMAQLLLNGEPPYLAAYNMKLPGIYVIYALFLALFGQTVQAVHLGLMMTNLVSIVLVFIIARRLFNDQAAVASAATFAMLTLSLSVVGTAAHATHFVVVFALGSFLFALKAEQSGRCHQWFLSGTLVTIGMLMKQPGIFFVAFVGLYLIYTELSKQSVSRGRLVTSALAYAAGVAVPLAIMSIWLVSVGAWSNFKFWVIDFAKIQGRLVSLADAPGVFWDMTPIAIGGNGAIWILAGVGLITVFVERYTRSRWAFLTGLLITGFLAICPSFTFRNHYYILLFPGFALLCGAAVCGIGKLCSSGLGASLWPLMVALAVVVFTFIGQSDMLLRYSPVQVSRAVYGANPFIEAVEIGKYLRENTDKTDTIAVLGSEAEIYFYSRRRAATGYIYMYSMMQNQKYALRMQRQMVEEIERANPKYIVVVNISVSWLRKDGAPTYLIDWANNYLDKYYDRVGVIDVMESSYIRTNYIWGADARDYVPISSESIGVYRRRDAA